MVSYAIVWVYNERIKDKSVVGDGASRNATLGTPKESWSLLILSWFHYTRSVV